MLEDLSTSKITHEALKLAVKKLNTTFPACSTQQGLEELVEFKIIKSFSQRELLFKIDDTLDENVREAIKNAIVAEAQKLQIKILTVLT